MNRALEERLGSATARLYEHVSEMVRAARRAGQDVRLAISSIALDILCGTFHDFRSGSAAPKSDLIARLESVPRGHPILDAMLDELADGVACGAYADGEEEARRMVDDVSPAEQWARIRETPDYAPIELTSRQWRVFAWLYRYVEVYGRSPSLSEFGAGIGLAKVDVGCILRELAKKGAVINLGGARGWIPTRRP